MIQCGRVPSPLCPFPFSHDDIFCFPYCFLLFSLWVKEVGLNVRKLTTRILMTVADHMTPHFFSTVFGEAKVKVIVIYIFFSHTRPTSQNKK